MNKSNKSENFIPRKMMLDGTTYYVDSLESLNKIKTKIQQKKKDAADIIEEQKNQKILVKKTRNGTVDEKTVKIINDLNKMPDIRKKPFTKPVSMPEKPKFNIKSSNGNKKVNDSSINSNTMVKKQGTLIKMSMDNNIKEPEIKYNISSNEKNLKIKTHDKKIIDNNLDKNVNGNTSNEFTKSDILSVKEQEETKPKVLNVKRSHVNNIINNNTINSNPLNTRKDIFITNNKINDDGINKYEEINDPANDSDKNASSDRISENANDGYLLKEYIVLKSQWYVLSFKAPLNNGGLIKIFDDNKNVIYPLVRINNDMFVYKSYNGQLNEYRLYIKTKQDMNKINIYMVKLNAKDIKFQEIEYNIVSKSIDLWRFRKLYDLEFIKYYLTNIKLDYSNKFLSKFNADYELFKNPNYFDNFIKTINIKNTIDKSNDIIKVIHLINSTIEYETNGYTLRTHNLVKNSKSDRCIIYPVSRYGYPYDKESNYYDELPKKDVLIDGINYIKLLNETEKGIDNDNYNSNNIIDYLKKYIIKLIELSIEKNISIIHATGNYLNGIAALYASKYLGTKCVYELRSLWDENIIANRPEVRNSDMIKMMVNLEKKVLNECDKIITVNNKLRETLIDNYYDENKISVVNNKIDINKFKPNNDKRVELRDKYSIDENEIMIGYIGTLSDHEGLEYILKCIQKLKEEKIRIRFMIIGTGGYKNKLDELIKEYDISDNIIYISGVNYNDISDYYNMFDLICYPKKGLVLNNSSQNYKILEAMSMGKPVIISNISIFDDIIVDNTNGLFFEKDNVDQLLIKMRMLINDKDLSNKLGNNARQWVIDNRSLNAENGLMDIYNN